MAPVRAPAPISQVVRAFVKCGGATDPTVANAILQALGWPTLSRSVTDPLPPLDSTTRAARAALPKREAEEAPRRIVPSTIRLIERPPLEDEPELPDVGLLPLPSAEHHRALYDKPIDPLFEPHLARSMLGRLSAVRLLRGELDLNLLVATIARARAPTKLPRRPISTLGPGLQLLIDVAPAMQPFHEDLVQLFRALRRTVGSHRIEAWNFEGCPSRGVIDDLSQERIAYAPPRPGTPVLIVTDLGLVRADRLERPQRVAEWHVFRRRLAARGTPLSILAPYCKERLGERGLTSRLRIILWDRETGVRQIPAAPLVRGFDD